jgi:hypothetical protein
MSDTTIANLHRLGSHEFLVLLACGHSYPVSDTDLTRLALFVGKRITCHECERKYYEADAIRFHGPGLSEEVTA